MPQTNTPKADFKAMGMGMAAFCMWGTFPVYWKAMAEVPPLEIMAHRILWAFIFMVGLVLVSGKFGALRAETKMILKSRKKIICLVAASVLLTCNWVVYIWAVNDNRIVEVSLGYYISPLGNVFLGIVIFRERLSRWQFFAVALATIGVLYLTLAYGSFPYVAIFLAITFSIYGMCKKITGLSAVSGMTLEMVIMAPIVLAFFYWLYSQNIGYPLQLWSPMFFLLAGSGIITAVPLIMFTYSLSRLPLTFVGLIQYVSPTLTLLLGVFVYGEIFTRNHMIAFIFIWSGLVLFTTAQTTTLARLERYITHIFRHK